MSTTTLRPARAGDAPGIGALWHAAWRDGHVGHVPDTLVALRTAASFATRAADLVPATTVAEVDGSLAGFASVSGDEVDQVFVAAAHRGSGIASALLTDAEQRVAGAGHPVAWLAVVAGNARARRFYERQGWSDDGAFDYEAPSADGPVAVACRRYVKALPAG